MLMADRPVTARESPLKKVVVGHCWSSFVQVDRYPKPDEADSQYWTGSNTSLADRLLDAATGYRHHHIDHDINAYQNNVWCR